MELDMSEIEKYIGLSGTVFYINSDKLENALQAIKSPEVEGTYFIGFIELDPRDYQKHDLERKPIGIVSHHKGNGYYLEIVVTESGGQYSTKIDDYCIEKEHQDNYMPRTVYYNHALTSLSLMNELEHYLFEANRCGKISKMTKNIIQGYYRICRETLVNDDSHWPPLKNEETGGINQLALQEYVHIFNDIHAMSNSEIVDYVSKQTKMDFASVISDIAYYYLLALQTKFKEITGKDFTIEDIRHILENVDSDKHSK